MSDVPPGPGWWKASDGNWYPPQSAPGVVTPPPAVPPPMVAPAKSNKGCLIALAIFFAVVVVGVIVGGVALTLLGRAASDKIEDVGDALSTPSTVDPNDVDARDEDQVLDTGESARISGFTATVQSAEFSEFIDGFPPGTYLVVEVSIENRDDTNQSPLSTAWTLQQPDGVVTYPATIDGSISGSINANVTAEGRIVFQVDDQQGDFFVLYRPDPIDEARGVWPVSR